MQNHIDRNDLDKDCFRHDMAYGKYKKLAKRTDPEKVSRDKSFKILGNPKMECYKRGLASLFYKFYDKKIAVSGIQSMSNQQVTDELQKPIIRKVKWSKVYSSFKGNIWATDLADMQLISKYNKRIFIMCH